MFDYCFCFMFLSDEGPTLKILDLLAISAVRQPFSISICRKSVFCKRQEKCLIIKIGIIHLHGSSKNFLLFDRFIVSV